MSFYSIRLAPKKIGFKKINIKLVKYEHTI